MFQCICFHNIIIKAKDYRGEGQTLEVDRHVGVSVGSEWTGKEGRKLAKLTSKKKKSKQQQDFKPLCNLILFCFYAENSATQYKFDKKVKYSNKGDKYKCSPRLDLWVKCNVF